MRRAILLSLLLGVPGASLAQNDSLPDCIHVQAIARYGAMAYNHVVRIDNDCGQRAHCRVSTNVNPQRQEVDVPAHGHVEVMTFMGSPAREFTPIVSCDLSR